MHCHTHISTTLPGLPRLKPLLTWATPQANYRNIIAHTCAPQVHFITWLQKRILKGGGVGEKGNAKSRTRGRPLSGWEVQHLHPERGSLQIRGRLLCSGVLKREPAPFHPVQPNPKVCPGCFFLYSVKLNSALSDSASLEVPPPHPQMGQQSCVCR